MIAASTKEQLILARRSNLHPKAVYICADLSSRPIFSLAVLRWTIHSREYREGASRAAIDAAIAQRTVASRQEWDPRAVSNQPTPALFVTRERVILSQQCES